MASTIPFFNKLKKETVNYPRVTPGKFNYSQQIEATKGIYDLANRIARQNSSEGTTQGQFLTGTLAANAAYTGAEADRINNIYMQQTNANNLARQQADAMNAQININQINEQQRATDIYEALRQQRLIALSKNLQEMIQNTAKTQADERMASNINRGGYKWIDNVLYYLAPDGNYYNSDRTTRFNTTTGKVENIT